MCAMSEVPVACEAARLMALWASGFGKACGASSAQTPPSLSPSPAGDAGNVVSWKMARAQHAYCCGGSAIGMVVLPRQGREGASCRIGPVASRAGWNGSMENMRPQLLLN